MIFSNKALQAVVLGFFLGTTRPFLEESKSTRGVLSIIYPHSILLA
jgi:hypothetical protein